MHEQIIGSVRVRTFPPPPRGFVPLDASAQELARHGFPARPDSVISARVAQRWVAAFRRYPDFEHLSPEFREMEHRHVPNARTEKDSEGAVNATSYNWSGSVLFLASGEVFKWISGSWTVPHVYPAPGATGTQYSSAWLGIDGDGSGDVLQAGTESDTDGSCLAWFEWYPNFAIAISNLPVAPGDVVSLVLCATSTTEAQMSIGNITAKKYTSFSFTAPQGTVLAGNCAEAIVEAPTVNGQQAQLPLYGEVFFDDTVAHSDKNAYDIGVGTPISMVAADGTTVLSAATLEANTDSIKVSRM